MRDAITNVCPGGTITFDPTVFSTAQTISLSSNLTINKNLTISGPGADKVTINQTGTNAPVFFIQSGNIVSISGLKITGGSSYGVFNLGGPMIISNSTISNNRAGLQSNGTGLGGSIENYYPMTLTNSTISGNSVVNTFGYHGGGVYTPTGTSLTPVQIISCTITGNTAAGTKSAGGLRLDYDNGGVMTVSNTIIAGNTGNSSATADVNGIDSGVAFTSNGDNLVGDGTGATGFTGTADQVGTSGGPRQRPSRSKSPMAAA